jgi:hypothetical protein
VSCKAQQTGTIHLTFHQKDEVLRLRYGICLNYYASLSTKTAPICFDLSCLENDPGSTNLERQSQNKNKTAINLLLDLPFNIYVKIKDFMTQYFK